MVPKLANLTWWEAFCSGQILGRARSFCIKKIEFEKSICSRPYPELICTYKIKGARDIITRFQKYYYIDELPRWILKNS